MAEVGLFGKVGGLPSPKMQVKVCSILHAQFSSLGDFSTDSDIAFESFNGGSPSSDDLCSQRTQLLYSSKLRAKAAHFDCLPRRLGSAQVYIRLRLVE